MNNNNQNIENKNVSTQKTHTCKKSENNDLFYNGKISSLSNTNNLAKALIKQNIAKPFTFHVNLLNKTKIQLTKRQIKTLLQDIRNEAL